METLREPFAAKNRELFSVIRILSRSRHSLEDAMYDNDCYNVLVSLPDSILAVATNYTICGTAVRTCFGVMTHSDSADNVLNLYLEPVSDEILVIK